MAPRGQIFRSWPSATINNPQKNNVFVAAFSKADDVATIIDFRVECVDAGIGL